MTRTPSPRRAAGAAARRRDLTATIERLAVDLPHRRPLAAQVVAAVALFGPDELELLERMASACVTACARALSEGVSVNPLVAIAAVVSRLLRGRATYGELTIDSDPRDWELEHYQEVSDAIVYDTIGVIALGRAEGGDTSDRDLDSAELAALEYVGQMVEHSTLAALVCRIQDSDRQEPFCGPDPWCLGSAMIFQHGAVRIESDQIAALRCHHCGAEWLRSSSELRFTGSGQYVIPTHEPARHSPLEYLASVTRRNQPTMAEAERDADKVDEALE